MNPGIYIGDCLELIPQLEDSSIDAVITDPPYGIAFQSSWRTEKLPKIENDERPFIEWIRPVFDKLKDGGRLVCFYRWDVQDAFLNEIKAAGFNVISQLVWYKKMHGMGDLKKAFGANHELMIYATKGDYEFKNGRPNTVYNCTSVSINSQKHPNEKPVPLIQAIIRDITEKNELIVDPFGGSFSTYKAANKEGRRCITYELHPHYAELRHEADKNIDICIF